MLETADGVRHAARTVEYSQKELRVRAIDSAFPTLSAGERISFEFAEETGTVRFEGVIAEVAEDWADIAVDLPDMAAERLWNSVTFSRRGMWAMKSEVSVDDRFLTGFLMLGRHALYGYRSMIEFLPGRILPAVRDAVLSVLPRHPAARKF